MAHVENRETHSENCPFCRILSGKDNQDGRIFYRDERVVAMFVNMPQTDGHFIVFPATHRSELNEMKTDLGSFFEKTHELAEEAIKKLGASAYILKLNNNIYRLEDNPHHVGHIHMHVVPRYNPEDEQAEPSDEYFLRLMTLIMTNS